MRHVWLIVLAALIWSCNSAPRHPSAATSPDLDVRIDPGVNPWTSLKLNNAPEQFQFAIVADRTGQHRPGVFERGLAKVNLLQPEFVMCVGDLIEGYTEDEADIDQQWDEIQSFTATLEMPFFYVPGNHDLSNDVQKRKWQQRFGRAYYHFVYRGVLFLVLNSEDPAAKIGPEQIAYVANALAENPDARWTCVFLHQPLWTSKKENGWSAIDDLLKGNGRNYTVFAGHHHAYTKYVRNDRRYIILATTGGGIKDGLTSPQNGTFDHVTWVTMMPDGPRLANLQLEGIFDENVRTEATAALIGRVLRSDGMRVKPMLSTDPNFTGATVEIQLVNDAEIPMQASGSFAPHGVLRASPETFDVTVPAGATQDLKIQLTAPTSTPLAELTPIELNWVAAYDIPNGTPIRIDRKEAIAPERILLCVARSKPVVVDGALDEWSHLPLAYAKPRSSELAALWQGPSDLSYKFAVERDERNVYVAVETIDDIAILNAKKMPWSQDGIEIRLDARPEPARSLGRGRAEFKEILVVSMSPGGDDEGMVFYNKHLLPPGVQAVCRKTPTGHTTEVAIPIGYLDTMQGEPWKQFRLNITVNDFDTVAGPLKSHWWRPDWRSRGTFSGSGTFEKR